MDDMTRNILLSLQKESPLHVRELKRRTEINQTPLYRRLHELLELRLVADDYLGSKRVFHLTAKGYKALLKDRDNRKKDIDKFAKSLLEDERYVDAITRRIQPKLQIDEKLLEQTDQIRKIQQENIDLKEGEIKLRQMVLLKSLEEEFRDLFETRRLVHEYPDKPNSIKFHEKIIRDITEQAKAVGIDDKEIETIRRDVEKQISSEAKSERESEERIEALEEQIKQLRRDKVLDELSEFLTGRGFITWIERDSNLGWKYSNKEGKEKLHRLKQEFMSLGGTEKEFNEFSSGIIIDDFDLSSDEVEKCEERGVDFASDEWLLWLAEDSSVRNGKYGLPERSETRQLLENREKQLVQKLDELFKDPNWRSPWLRLTRSEPSGRATPI
jgi:DNA-binding Lrp family transcriptional regulator